MHDKKIPLVHINLRLPEYVVEHFKQFPSYTKEIREALEDYVREAQDAGATQVPLDPQRWHDIVAEEERHDLNDL